PCTFYGCNRHFRNRSGLTKHVRTTHAHVKRHDPMPPLPSPSPGLGPHGENDGPEVPLVPLSSPHADFNPDDDWDIRHEYGIHISNDPELEGNDSSGLHQMPRDAHTITHPFINGNS
ncbi:MAG: hypothetical protein ACREHG_06750, partial [Candidatus Saccharimonadales bacterium]